MIQIDSRIYDDIFLLAKILEKTELSKDEKARVYKRFEKSTEIQEILNYLDTTLHPIISPDNWNVYSELHDMVSKLPSAQPEQRYTKEELMVFRHGISLSLLSKRSAQRWQYDEDTATEIEFLERLYEKVGADIRGEEVGNI